MFFSVLAVLALALPVPAISSSNNTCTPEKIQTRIEWANMKSADQQSYLKAVKCLMQLPARTGIEGTVTRFDDMNAMHQVWWDETRDAGNFMDSPLLDPDTGFGGNGTGPDNCVTDGPFANTTLHIGPGQTLTDHCLSRKVNEINSTLGNETYVQECHDKSTYLDFWEATGFKTHGAGHSGVGGVMEDIDASPGDPLFYIHHGFIDRLWWKWQSEDPASRLYQLGGPSIQGGTEETTLDYVMTTYGIRPNVTVKEVMDIQGGFLCYKYDY
ncbi:monophenol monooxygenase [Fusarium tjaetaba]|uniref:Monophenol monooxygenase n=1 Tax=Fusarium tjaetaba TaxID=1567544 RepID=A0A8H5W1F9_9HYPO|nr:monophenol monooxygenase [Fusarium tjaetaba]KAF5643351.1 monophenol monooxygenase [Fusarium tjaetaba]